MSPPFACKNTQYADGPLLIYSHSEFPIPVKMPFVLDTIRNRQNPTRDFMQNECTSIKKKCGAAQIHPEAASKSRIGDDVESLVCRKLHDDIARAQPNSSSTPLNTLPGHDLYDEISCLVRELELSYPRPSTASQASSIFDPVRLLRNPDSCDPPRIYSRKKCQP